jgi:peptidyl-tRNA hydrolase, PTH1 family
VPASPPEFLDPAIPGSRLPNAKRDMSSLAHKIVVGLGNPGKRYAGTRHNAGSMVVDLLAGECGRAAWVPECESLVCRAEIGGREVLLAKPLTFMNRSGEAVRLLLEESGLAVSDLILVVDDFNLPFGRVRVRRRGSAGGHNGLESVIRILDTGEFIRIRLGIGETDMPVDKAVFVLDAFPPGQREELREMIMKACAAVKMVLSDGVSRAMSVFNA